MGFHKINSYTWILPDGKKSIDEIKKLIDDKSLTKSDRFVENRQKNERRNPDYKKFCTKVFEDRKFIPQVEFNRLIAEKFNSNTTFYRKQMEAKGLITIKNKVVFKTD